MAKNYIVTKIDYLILQEEINHAINNMQSVLKINTMDAIDLLSESGILNLLRKGQTYEAKKLMKDVIDKVIFWRENSKQSEQQNVILAKVFSKQN